ncbi:MAG: Mor transcription activator family protein [Ruminococcaceae bacterium]|nr:Mor transcription activator family protein [Oscillospiraceae bacterium]
MENKNNSEMLNDVYKEISEQLGMDVALNIYQMFRGQQISFPVRFFNPNQIQKQILKEYDGSNVRKLAVKYNYSEKTIRRILKDGKKE